MIAAGVSLLVSLLSISVLMGLAPRWNLVDTPQKEKHKAHESPTPLVGGIGIGIAAMIGWSLLDAFPFVWWPFAGAGLALLVTGVWDDRLQLSTTIRFGVQILATIAVALYANVVLLDVGALLTATPLETGWLAIPFTIFAMVGIINALNMIDGMDGLAGSIALVAFVGLLAVAILMQRWGVMFVLLVPVAALLGFLVFNLRIAGRAARVFLGDAGSLFLGFLLTCFLVFYSQTDERLIPPVLALWFVAVPLFDTIALMIRRWRKGQKATQADREHIHHLLLAAGFQVNQVLLMIVGFAVSMMVLGILLWVCSVPEYLLFYGFVAISFMYLALVSNAWRRRVLFGRVLNRDR